MERIEIITKSANLPREQFRGKDKVHCDKYFKDIIQKRINHCEQELEKNLHHAKDDYPIIHWNGGHFNAVTWRTLKSALNQDMYSWDRLVWQQIVRQMAREDSLNLVAFDVATEFLLIQE